jgi:hypothetical protein
MMKKLWNLASIGAVAGLALSSASAQSVIFEDDFENGAAQWVLETGWNLTTINLPCISASQTPSSAVARFGLPGSCWFQTEPGRMTTLAPIDIPADAPSARLRFASYESTECGFGNCGWDHRSVYVSRDVGQTWDLVWEGGKEGVWIEKSADLSSYLGESVLISFEFDAIDWWGNEFLGWLVDDVRVEIDAAGGPVIYCSAKVNSQGCGPLMSYAGDVSLTGPDDLVLSTSYLRNNVYGSFAWSTGINNTPFQGGTLCVQIPARRTTTVSTGGTAAPTLDCSGSYSWLFSHDYLIVNGIEPGETVHCQFFGRDVGTGAPMTLSDAVRVTILP